MLRYLVFFVAGWMAPAQLALGQTIELASAGDLLAVHDYPITHARLVRIRFRGGACVAGQGVRFTRRRGLTLSVAGTRQGPFALEDIAELDARLDRVTGPTVVGLLGGVAGGGAAGYWMGGRLSAEWRRWMIRQ